MISPYVNASVIIYLVQSRFYNRLRLCLINPAPAIFTYFHRFRSISIGRTILNHRFLIGTQLYLFHANCRK